MKKTLCVLFVLCMVLACTAALADAPSYRKGDANLDGLVTTGDATAVLRYTVGTRDLSDAALVSSDYNSDGLINTGDVVCILRRCSCRVAMDDVNSRAFVYNLSSNVSSDWVGYRWLLKYQPGNSGEIIYSATSREYLEKFTDPNLCPFAAMQNKEESGTLAELTARYDDEYFASNDIIFIAVHEPVIAKDAAVTDVCRMDDKLTLDVTVFYPEVCMQASQDHIIIVEIPKTYTAGAELVLETADAILEN